jgi:hypothetical protein
MIQAEHAARIGEISVFKILVGKPDRKRPLGRPRCRWGDNIGMELRETKWEGVDCMKLAQDRDQ